MHWCGFGTTFPDPEPSDSDPEPDLHPFQPNVKIIYTFSRKFQFQVNWHCCSVGIRDVYPGSQIPDPDYYPSRIPDPKTAMKDIGEKKFVVIPFFWSHKFHKIELFYFWYVEKKIWANFQRIIELFNQKIVSKSKLSKIWVWDPGSGKNLFRIPDPGVKKAPDPGSGSATLHCCE